MTKIKDENLSREANRKARKLINALSKYKEPLIYLPIWIEWMIEDFNETNRRRYAQIGFDSKPTGIYDKNKNQQTDKKEK